MTNEPESGKVQVVSLSCGESRITVTRSDCPRSRADWIAWAEQHTEKVLQPPGQRRPCVRLLKFNSQTLLLKDFFHLPLGVSKLVGGVSISNEARTYQRLFWVPGVPQMLCRPSWDSLLLQYVSGTPVHQMQPGEIPFELIDQARQLVTSLHKAGVVHGDLGHDFDGDFGRDTNLIWGDNGQLYVVDFAGALHRGMLSFGLFETFRRHDLLVVTKLLRRFFPERDDVDGYRWDELLSGWQLRTLRLLKKI